MGAALTLATLTITEVLVMWVEVVERSKKLSRSKAAKCGKIALFKMFLNSQNVILAIAAIGLIIINQTEWLNALITIIVLEMIFLYIYCAKLVTDMIGGPKGANQTKSSTVLAIETARNRAVGVLVPFAICAFAFVVLYGGAKDLHGFSFILISFNFLVPAPLSNTMITYVRYGARKKLIKAGFMDPPPAAGLGITDTGPTKTGGGSSAVHPAPERNRKDSGSWTQTKTEMSNDTPDLTPRKGDATTEAVYKPSLLKRVTAIWSLGWKF